MIWTYTYHRFADRKAFLAALASAGAWLDEDGNVCAPVGVAIDEVGVIQTGGKWDDSGEMLAPPTALPGWHVNMAWAGEIPKEWVESQVDPEPKTPSRVWA